MKVVQLQDVPPRGVSHAADIEKRPLLVAGEAPGLRQFAQALLRSGQAVAGHTHRDMTEVFFVSSGVGVLTVSGRPVPLSPGTCVRVDPGEEHAIRNTGAENLTLLYLCLAC